MESENVEEKDTQTDGILPELTTSNPFIFSKPILATPKTVNFDFKHAFDTCNDTGNVFTFSVPPVVSKADIQEECILSNFSDRQYKPRIARNAYQPPVNIFAQALKDTTVFEQLKKNSRSQVSKINVENSITCTNVPQALLTKAAAKEYFTQFGNFLKIAIRPKKQIITATYATKEETTVAYYNSGEYLGEKFNVEWSKSCLSPKSPTKKKDIQKNIVSNLLKAPDDEIISELDAMMNLEYNTHSNIRDNNEAASLKRNRTVRSKGTSKATLRMEKSIGKGDKLRSDNQISDLLPNTSVEELQNIIQQASFTSEDRYKVLEARDRLMRFKQVKSHTLAAAKAMSGTCPDMCPEKERLMREAKRQVAVYEQLDSSEYGINHMTAVKQYSRSSADQEEPMAHELRPVKTLKMTMSYLLHEIANLCDQQGTNLGEWYHFLWDRTRGIRKDITQQELCCIDSVILVEQCARFHIVCSERLCAEDLSVFDKKINSDNLTKCLQSLKYMYHDLRVKGITCKNEPEFRAYIILLNLNNGNFMWDVQRLPATIQKSTEVQFAIDVYSTLESNNYYKFFQLVRKTSYLNACILLRYFNQVRLKALSVMVKAYCRTTSTAYPLYELIDILGFEDENEAIYFCDQVGLNVSKDDLHVLLNRQNFSMPLLNLKQNRACNLIESKRTALKLSIGQCIAGGKMPEKIYKGHKPLNSFNASGHLKAESVNAKDQDANRDEEIDPYEFVDDATTIIQKPYMSDRSQNKVEVTDTTRRTNVLKPPVTSESCMNSFTTVKSETTFSFTSKPLTQSVPNNKTQITAVQKANADKHIDTKTTFTAKQQNAALTETKHNEPIAFSGTFNKASLTSKAPNIFSKQFDTMENSNVAMPFVMATNRNLFSSTAQGNTFNTNATLSTTFAKSHLGVQVAPTVSDDTAITSITNVPSNDNPNRLPDFTTTKKQVQKQLSENTDSEKLQLKELENKKIMQRISQDADEVLNELQVEVIEEYCSSIVKEDINRMNACNALSNEVNNDIFHEVIQEICSQILKEGIVNQQKLHKISMKIKNRVVLKYFHIWQEYVQKKKQHRKALDTTPVWLQMQSIEECARLLYTKEQHLVIQNMNKKPKVQEAIKSHVDSLAPIEVIIYAGLTENLKSLDMDAPLNLYWKMVIIWPDLENRTLLGHHKKIMNQYLCPDNYNTEPIIKVYRPNQNEALHICITHFEDFTGEDKVIGSDALLFIASTSEDVKCVTRRLVKTVLLRHKLTPIPLVVIVLENGNLETQDQEIVSQLETLLSSGYLSQYTMIFERNISEKIILNLAQSAILWLAMNRSPPNPLEMYYLQDICDTCLTEELWLRMLGDSSFNAKLCHALKDPNFVIDLHNEAVTHLMDIVLDPETFLYTKFPPELKKFLKSQYTMPCSYEFFDDIWRKEDYEANVENIMLIFVLPQWKYPWPIEDTAELHENIMNYCRDAFSDANDGLISSNILSNLLLTSSTSTVSSFIDILLSVVKEKMRFISKDLKVIYNKNHLRHFRTLSWWFKSNIFMEYNIPLEEFSRKDNKKGNDADGSIAKKRRLETSKDVSISDETLSDIDPLAAFCESTRNRVMEVHHASMEIENRLETHQRENSSFEEKLRNALIDELIESITMRE